MREDRVGVEPVGGVQRAVAHRHADDDGSPFARGTGGVEAHLAQAMDDQPLSGHAGGEARGLQVVGVGERLLAGETYNPSGLWSSYPPHKHDTQRAPEESKLEEVYHFRVKPAGGFGIQRVYGDGFDDAYAVQNRDTVAIARGYHPVAAAPGYELYYLWILAGEERVLHWWEDPSHSWVSSQA